MNFVNYTSNHPIQYRDPTGLTGDCGECNPITDTGMLDKHFGGLIQAPAGFDPDWDKQLDEYMDNLEYFEAIAKALENVKNFAALLEALRHAYQLGDGLIKLDEWLSNLLHDKSFYDKFSDVDDDARRRLLKKFIGDRIRLGWNTYVRVVYFNCEKCGIKDPTSGRKVLHVAFFRCGDDDPGNEISLPGDTIKPAGIRKCIEKALSPTTWPIDSGYYYPKCAG